MEFLRTTAAGRVSEHQKHRCGSVHVTRSAHLPHDEQSHCHATIKDWTSIRRVRLGQDTLAGCFHARR